LPDEGDDHVFDLSVAGGLAIGHDVGPANTRIVIREQSRAQIDVMNQFLAAS
jgi:hypothetical protein